MARNWTEAGIKLVDSDVSRRHGENASDKVVIGKAPIPVIEDLDKFRVAFGDQAILGAINGTSIRVMAQEVGRKGIEAKLPRAEVEERLWNRLKGIRNPALGGSTVTIVKYTLPNGELWSGTDLTEFEATFAATMVDMGVDTEIALTAASNARKRIEAK